MNDDKILSSSTTSHLLPAFPSITDLEAYLKATSCLVHPLDPTVYTSTLHQILC